MLIIQRFFKEYKKIFLCIPADIELSYRLLLSLLSIIAVSVYPKEKTKGIAAKLLYYVSLIRACLNFNQFDHQLVYMGPRICVV